VPGEGRGDWARDDREGTARRLLVGLGQLSPLSWREGEELAGGGGASYASKRRIKPGAAKNSGRGDSDRKPLLNPL